MLTFLETDTLSARESGGISTVGVDILDGVAEFKESTFPVKLVGLPQPRTIL